MAALTIALALAVRLYDTGSLADADRHAAIAVAADLLLTARIETTWPQCPPPRPAPRPAGVVTQDAFVCDKPIGLEEVAVRIVGHSMPGRPTGPLPLGDSLIEPALHRGTLATIYLDRVNSIAADAGVPLPVLLGRAMAHEIGHLLLGTIAHSKTGLMRAMWTRRTLEQANPADWRFSASEGASMRRAVDRRVPVLTTADRRNGSGDGDGRKN